MLPMKKNADEERIKKMIEMLSGEPAKKAKMIDEVLETPEDEAMETPEEQAMEEEEGTELHDKKGRLFGHPRFQIMISLGKNKK